MSRQLIQAAIIATFVIFVPTLKAEHLIISGTLPVIIQNQQILWSPTVAGGLPPYRYDIEKGALPQGLSLNESNGEISGSTISLGQADFVLRVRDVKNEHAILKLNPHLVAPLEFVFESGRHVMPFGINVTRPFKPSGGRPPYTFTISAGALPPGFRIDNDSINPMLAGRWDSVGSALSSFEIRLTDSLGTVTSRQVEINFIDYLYVYPDSIGWCGEVDKTERPISVLLQSSAPGAVAVLTKKETYRNWPELSPTNLRLPGKFTVSTEVLGKEEIRNMITVIAGSAQEVVDVEWVWRCKDLGFGELTSPLAAKSAKEASAPTITVSESSTELHAIGDEASVSTSLILRAHKSNLRYAVHSDSQWLAVDKPTGDLQTDIKLNITAYPKGLSPGLHQASLGFYDQTGQLMAQTDILLRIAPEGIPLQLSRHSVRFSPESSEQTLVIYNPNNTPANFQMQTDQDAYRVSPTSGSIPPRSEAIIKLSASPEAPPQADLVLALNQTQLELVSLASTSAAQTCASKPASVEVIFPGQHATISTHGTVRFRLKAVDGCGKPIQSGIVSLRAPDNSLVPLHLDSTGDWHGSWQDKAGIQRVFHFIAQWQNLQGFESEQLTIQVNIKP